MPNTDFKLFQQIKAGNRTAFNQLFQLYYEQLVRQAHQTTQNLANAEDIVQAVFIDFWAKRDQISIEKSVVGYLTRMVQYRCIDYFRQQKSQQKQQENYFQNSLSLAISSPEADLLSTENLAAIHKKIDALPPKCSIVFKMSRFEEMNYAEIAEQLGITKKTVEYHISTALRLLRKSVFGVLFFSVFKV